MTDFNLIHARCADCRDDNTELFAWDDLSPDGTAALLCEVCHGRRSEVLRAAADLLSDRGENPEYDRAIVELTCDVVGIHLDHKYDLLALLRGDLMTTADSVARVYGPADDVEPFHVQCLPWNRIEDV